MQWGKPGFERRRAAAAVRHCVLACALGAVLASCHGHEAGDGAADASFTHEGELLAVPESSPLRQVLVLQAVAKQQAQTPLSAPAVLEPDPSRVANVLPPVSGRIAALYVHLGDEVKAGQPLFALESADLAQDRADLQHARIGLEQVDGPYRGHAYDVRPTHFDLAPSPDAAGRANAWVKDENGKVIGLVAYPGGMPALFASNIESLSIEDVRFSRPSPLPVGWNAEATVIREGEPVVWSAP